MSRFRRASLVLAVLLVAAGGYSLYWYRTASALRNRLGPWAEARASEGYYLHWREVRVGGFPSAFRFDFSDLRFSTLRPLPITMTADTASAWATPWNLKHWEFSARHGAEFTELTGSTRLTAARLDGALDTGNAGSMDLDLSALDLAGAGLARGLGVGRAEAHIELPTTAPQNHTATALGLSLQLTQATLPITVPGFGDTLSSFSFSAQLKGALPPGPLVQALGQWRDNGGTVELQSLRLRWGSLLVDASGTLALDAALQPEGAMSAVITGQDAAIDAAASSGALKPREATAAKAVLALLAKPGNDGQKAITLPVTVQGDRLYLGPAKVADIPRISW